MIITHATEVAFTRHTPKGFTLTECLLSVTITATALLSVIGMLMGTLGGARDARAETVSGLLVRQLAGEARELAPPSEDEPQKEVIVLLDQAMQVIGHSRVNEGQLKARYDMGTSDQAAAVFASMRRVRDEKDLLMDRILISVETPASAPVGQRKVLQYATLAPK